MPAVFCLISLVFVLLPRQSNGAPRNLFPVNLFDEGQPIRSVKITVAKKELISLIRDHRKYVGVTIQEGANTYTNVALRLKGNEGGSFRSLYDKPAMTINFDKFESGLKFHGQDKLYFNNSVEDESFMHEYLGSLLFRAAGVPAPRITWAMVELNGRSRGLYVVKEGFDKQFLRKYFRGTKGNFYDGGFVDDLYDGLRRSSGSGPEENGDLKQVVAACREPDPAVRWKRLNELLDMERVLSFLTMEVLTGHWDGYAMNRNNYRIYNNPGAGITFLPHGMDILWTDPDSPPEPYMDGLVARAIMQTEEGNKRFHARMAELREDVFNPEQLHATVSGLATKLRPLVAKGEPEDLRKFDSAVVALRSDLKMRASHAAAWDLSYQRKLLEFDARGVAKLTDWTPRDEQGGGRLSLVGGEGENGRTLYISGSKTAESRPSWRKAVWLTPGHYQFSGKVSTKAVEPISFRHGEGAGIRVAGSRAKREGVSGDSEWKELQYKFVVDGRAPRREVELICELNASTGDAWFDLGSLQLERLESP